MQIKSVKGEKQLSCPFGEGPAKALTEVLRIGQNLGFKTKNINNYVGYVEYWYRKKNDSYFGAS